jgi:hypothetical protein
MAGSKGKRLDVKGAVGKLRRSLDDRLVRGERALTEGAEGLVKDIKAKTPVDTGALRDSVRVEPAGKKVLVVAGGVDDPRVGRVDYGEYVGMEEIIAQVLAGSRRRLVKQVETEVRK